MKTFKQILSEVEKPDDGKTQAMFDVATAPGEVRSNEIATDAQFRGTTKKQPREGDKETGDGTRLPGQRNTAKPADPVAHTIRMMARTRDNQHIMDEQVETLEETFKAGAMKLKDGSSVKITTEDAKALNSLFGDLTSSNKKKMQERLEINKSSFTEIVGFAKEL